MLAGKRLYLYSDANVVGGHEILTAAIANTLATRFSCEVHFAFYAEAIAPLLNSAVQPLRLPFHCKEPKFRHAHQWDTTLLRQQLDQIQPQLAVISQGYIESGLRGLLAARRAGIYTGSYIPFGQSNRELGNRFALLRDLIGGALYRLNAFYLTISHSQAAFLQQRINHQPLRIVNNPVNLKPEAPSPPPVQTDFTTADVLHLAVIGRVNFKQKNQAQLIAVAQQLKTQRQQIKFHIVGDGPDLGQLKHAVDKAGLNKAFNFHGWLNKRELAALLQQQIHCVLLPSIYEGLPLAFLESVYRGKPVICSNLPFVNDYNLPAYMRFNPHRSSSIAECIRQFPKAYRQQDMREIQHQVLQINSTDQFDSDIGSAFAALFAEAEKFA
ncbi:glycosyltransferase [Teredinibacter turnerae]|uniref:glycosyltransferase n=1 Tax=Teredinibacter turnerae TaxID=2426 RepID=UPI0030CD92F9